jgi:hypothetical protein
MNLDDLPAQYREGVGSKKQGRPRGADLDAVAGQASHLSRKFLEAQEKSDLISKGSSRDRYKPFDELIDQVKSYARESRDTSTPTVLAPMAKALMGLDGKVRDEVLKRAGNPEVFEPLRNRKSAIASKRDALKPSDLSISNVTKSPLTMLTDK